MSSTVLEGTDSTALSSSIASQAPAEMDIIEDTVVSRPPRSPTPAALASIIVMPEAVENGTPAEPVSFCMTPDLLIALRATHVPLMTGSGESETSEPVSFCMVPDLSHAFIALRATRIPVVTGTGHSCTVVLVTNTARETAGDAPVWGLISCQALQASTDAVARKLIGGLATSALDSRQGGQAQPGPGTHTGATGTEFPEVMAVEARDGAEPGRPRHRTSWKSSWLLLEKRQFRLYFFGSLICNLGTWLQGTAQIIIAFQFTNSIFTVGLVASAQFAGMIVISPWAAILAARHSSRAVLIGTQFASAIIAVLMALCYGLGILNLPLLFFGALGLGFAYALALPVQTALVPALVDEADTPDAIKMNSVSYNAGRALAPALSVLVVASLGPDLIFIVNAATFVIFALFLRRLDRIAEDISLRLTVAAAFRRRISKQAVRKKFPVSSADPFQGLRDPDDDAEHRAGLPPANLGDRPGAFTDQPKRTSGLPEQTSPVGQPRARLTDGLVIALLNRRILLLLAIVAAVTLADDPILVLSPALAQARLHVSAEWAGYFIAAIGWGSVLGSLPPTSARRDGGRRASRYAAVSLLVLGLTVVLFAWGISPLASLAAAAAAGTAGLFTGAAAQTALLGHQKKTSASIATAASIAALWAIAWAGTKPFASLLDGWLASHIGMMPSSVVLVSPALIIALCELLLPAWLRGRINRGAARIATLVVPRLISAAPGFFGSALLSRAYSPRHPLPQLRSRDQDATADSSLDGGIDMVSSERIFTVRFVPPPGPHESQKSFADSPRPLSPQMTSVIICDGSQGPAHVLRYSAMNARPRLL